MKITFDQVINKTLKHFEGYKFNTQEFILYFKSDFPSIYKNVIKRYGAGGKGSGNYFSGYSYFATKLKQLSRTNYITFISFIKAPPSWGNGVIALWEYNPYKIETIRIDTSISDDINEIIASKFYKSTQKESLILTRIGQGDFRKSLIAYWKKCAITGCDDTKYLIASHIKPWAACNNRERTDVFNGILLIPNLDKLFDKGLISFSDNGTIMISRFISAQNMQLLNVSKMMKIQLDKRHVKYIKYHRDNVFSQKLKE